MGSLGDMFVGVILTGLCVFALLSFAISSYANNQVNNTILNIDTVNRTYGNLYSNLTSVSPIVKSQNQGVDTETPSTGFGSLLFFSVISAGRIFKSLTIGTLDIILSFLYDVILSQEFLIALGVIGAIIVARLVLWAWRLWRLGE